MAGVQVNVRLDPDLAAALRAHAASTGRREGQVVADALTAWLDAHPAGPGRLVDCPDLVTDFDPRPQPVANVWGGYG